MEIIDSVEILLFCKGGLAWSIKIFFSISDKGETDISLRNKFPSLLMHADVALCLCQLPQ